MPPMLPADSLKISAAVVTAAIAIPIMPNKLPRMDVVGWLKPLSAWMKQIDAIKYIRVTRLMLILQLPVLQFSWQQALLFSLSS